MDRVLSVTEFNQTIKSVVEENSFLRNVAVVGEISDYKVHNKSGHVYLTLKDDTSMIKATMWRTYAHKIISLNPKDGMKIKVIGSVSHYVAGGSISLNIVDAQLDGEGEAKRKYNELLQEYESRGWFDASNKKPINKCPNRIAIITAREGDAIHDIVTNIRKKTKAVELFLFPALVQGEGSAESIAKQIKNVNNFHLDIDTIILGRGGGSYEHLASFNEPIVVETIFNSRIPIVTGIGHDKDETIACFVSDLNCSTPTGAGSESVLAVADILSETKRKLQQLALILKNKLSETRNNIRESFGNFSRFLTQISNREKIKLQNLKQELGSGLTSKIKHYEFILTQTKVEQKSFLKHKLQLSKSYFENLKEIIFANDVNNNFKKGYSIILKDNKSIKSVNDVTDGDEVIAKVYDGDIKMKVIK
jgi:exodeoxyribonuclease VII large subunit